MLWQVELNADSKSCFSDAVSGDKHYFKFTLLEPAFHLAHAFPSSSCDFPISKPMATLNLSDLREWSCCHFWCLKSGSSWKFFCVFFRHDSVFLLNQNQLYIQGLLAMHLIWSWLDHAINWSNGLNGQQGSREALDPTPSPRLLLLPFFRLP